MFKKGISLCLCVLLLMTTFSGLAMAQTVSGKMTGVDLKQNLPIKDGLESTTNVTGLQAGTVSLSRDRVSGNYSVQIAVVDDPSQNGVSFYLTRSNPFYITEYSKIKVWVKPSIGSK